MRRRLGLGLVHGQPPHCLRRIDRDQHYPEDLEDEVHADGEIWSRALWDIRKRARRLKADTIILQAPFDFADDDDRARRRRTVAAAQRIYGNAAANAVKKVFEDRGILS